MTTTETRIRIEYGTDHVIMSWDGSQASAPIKVDGQVTQYQTADARHRTANAVLCACKVAWPEAQWPERPSTGDDEIEATEAWDEMSYETLPDSDVEISDEMRAAVDYRNR